ncbi:hypothetical protein AAG570_009903 [Ranatra chinensis]|uniref:Uncharacterized protein n=1 Tax=Ranatra chinensis TaxID=642074 RepID=A0ABD0YQJ6_9HEMI
MNIENLEKLSVCSKNIVKLDILIHKNIINSRYGSSGFTSRFLNKSKSSAVVSPEEEDPGTSRRFGTSSSSTPSSTTNQSPRSRYTALKERRARLARSRSTHNLGVDDDDDDDDVVAANSPAAYLAGKYGTNNELTRSRSTHAIKSRETTPERPSNTARTGSSHLGGSGTSGEKDGAALSSWARYLKNKYGVRGKDGSGAGGRRLSLGLPLRGEVSDDDQKNSPGSPTSPTQHPLHQGFAVNSGTRSQYAAKRRQVFSVGSRGSEPGCFTWPRGVATGPDNSIVVADSSNHRVQVFDSNGIFLKEFGGYGNGEGEFDCLAGVAVNRIGQFIIADRYNHRIQVFQSDGTFVGKFGSHGSKVGQLDHPHYIAVSNTNRVIVSDSNNHRIQIFDVNGRVLSSFGQEGSEESQFKFPRLVEIPC